MGGGVSVDNSTFTEHCRHRMNNTDNEEWKMFHTKEQLIEKYKEIDGMLITDCNHLELR